MLEIGMNNVVKNYGFMNVLDGASLEIMSGERVAVVGRNGSGKSTILKIITGEENVNDGIVTVRRGASVGYLEQIPALAGRETPTRSLLMEPFAEVHAIENRMRELESLMAEAGGSEMDKLMKQYTHQQSLFETMDGYAVEENFNRVTVGFGLTELLDRPFNVLSGGQKTIVMLARTILSQPDILLLDEPTNHLDIRTLEWFEGYLAKYKGTVVMVSHDRYFLDKVANKTVILRQGKCETYGGNYSFSLKEQERQLLIEFEHYKNQQKKIDAMKAAIKRYREWAARADNEALYRKAKELEKKLEKMEILEKPELEKPKLPISFSGDRTGRDVLKVEALSLGFGDLRLLEDVNFTLFYLEKACLMGDNGSGKTTFIRAILGQQAYDGSMTVAPSAKTGYIAQEIRFNDDKMSVLEAFKDEYPCSEGEARNILAKYFFFGENVFKRVSALSGGEKVLLKLAILVKHSVNFLILDEPTNHIDIETREMLEEALLDYKGTILFISHDRYFIRKIATRIFVLSEKTIASYSCDYDTYREQYLRI